MNPAKLEWFFPDAYLPSRADNDISHEAICVLNTSDNDANIEISLYFQDREPKQGFTAKCGARRTYHIPLHLITDNEGKAIEQCVPYALYLKSDVPVMCQYTRVDATQPAYSLMTTMGL